jgi:hypothetical protein
MMKGALAFHLRDNRDVGLGRVLRHGREEVPGRLRLGDERLELKETEPRLGRLDLPALVLDDVSQDVGHGGALLRWKSLGGGVSLRTVAASTITA